MLSPNKPMRFVTGDVVRIIHTGPMRQRGIAGALGTVTDFLGYDRSGTEHFLVRAGRRQHRVCALSMERVRP